jgi:uncharacterized protein with HEPN domain
MNDESRKWLYDIVRCIDSIEEYIGKRRIFEEYEKNKMLRRAVEREIQIIGEAVNKFLKQNPEIAIRNSHQILATRNRITHAYDAVNNSIIWGIVINHLPGLRAEIEELLKEK